MARVRFISDFSWRQPGFTIDYKAGSTLTVRRICADEAIAAGKAEPGAAGPLKIDEVSVYGG